MSANLYSMVQQSHSMGQLLAVRAQQTAQECVPSSLRVRVVLEGQGLTVTVWVPRWWWVALGVAHLWAWYRLRRCLQRTQDGLGLWAQTKVVVK